MRPPWGKGHAQQATHIFAKIHAMVARGAAKKVASATMKANASTDASGLINATI